ncbi:hypothetical protein A4A49_07243 [Nicotiana attenuata]|uniref:Uncharacterized protein n=1 Tax=Nicotiana attenuata TaxID=49451 RepID=A0A1J6IXR8_NICAT|nr:hypothetical protein A4A49_07243 [Nicotiana attenuata]
MTKPLRGRIRSRPLKVGYDVIKGTNLTESSVRPELHKKFEEVVEDQGKGKEVAGTTANSTKVLSSGKALGKTISNPTRREWMQWRQNKYQRNKQGYIINNAKGKEDDKLKGKINEEAVATKNSFDVLEVDEAGQPILRITDGKEEPTGSSSPKGNGYHNAAKENPPNPVDDRIEEGNKKESTLDWVHRHFGDTRALIEARTTGVTTMEVAAKKNINATVNPSEAVEVLANVEGDPVELSGGDQIENVHDKVLNDTVRSEHETTYTKPKESNGIVIPVSTATVNPNMGSVYEL